MQGYRGLVTDLARSEVEHGQPGQEIVALERMQAITLEIIIQVVFGVTGTDRLNELRPLVTRIANLNLIALLAWKMPLLKRVPPWRGYADAQRRLDELLYSEIANRRSDPNAAERSDLLSRLLRPDGDGDTLTDAELRDQLVTFLLAGHRRRQQRWPGRSMSWPIALSSSVRPGRLRTVATPRGMRSSRRSSRRPCGSGR